MSSENGSRVEVEAEQPRRRSARHRAWLAGAALAVMVGATLGCDFPAINSPEDVHYWVEELGNRQTPLYTTNPDKSTRAVINDVPGKIQVQHGHTCAVPAQGGVRVRETAAFPAGLDEGTVIFNGAVASYLGGTSHHVRMLGSGAIVDVTVERGAAGRELHWDAAGTLTDDDGNRFEWCYFYTLLFWRRGSDGLQAIVHDQTVDKVFGEFDRAPKAVHAFTGSVQVDPARVATYGSPRALLPRGNALWFAADTEDDHHLLQAGFDLGLPSFTTTSISWTSQSLLKDNDAWRHFSSAEMVEVMSGPSVNMWQPPSVSRLVAKPTPHFVTESTAFTLQPRAPLGSLTSPCVASPVSNQVDEYAVDVPYSFAVPMLTGWEVSQPCHDSHVLQTGAYLASFSFTPNSNGRSGRLRYTVVTSLTDDDGGKLDRGRNRVTILGLNPITPGRPGPITPPLPPILAP